MLRALVAHPAFGASRGKKLRDPSGEVAATWRALGSRMTSPRSDSSAANAVLWQASSLGASPFDWPSPDGAPSATAEFATPARVLKSTALHWVMACSWWPTEQARHLAPAARLPQRRIRFDRLVCHLARRKLHTRSTPQMLRAACEITETGRYEVVDADHPIARWKMPALVSVFLDSPQHLTH